MSNSHFLTLDASKKPIVRKGVEYQSFVPPVLPGSGMVQTSRATQLKKVHVAFDVKLGNALEKVSKSLPDMGPFNRIARELASEYFESQDASMSDEASYDGPSAASSSYWDQFELSLDRIVKQEETSSSDVVFSSFSLESLRGLLAKLEAWNQRAIAATVGTHQVRSSEVDELLEEARIMSQRVELPTDALAKLRVLQKAGRSFRDKVQANLPLRSKDKVPLNVLTDLMKEAEALPIETEEVRYFRNQRGRIQAVCHSAQKATKDKSLDKSRAVTIEAAEVRAILPDLKFLNDQVSRGEWVQKALSKVDKRSSVSIQVIEQLFEDPTAALIKPEECEIMKTLKDAMDQAHAWQAKAEKILAGTKIQPAGTPVAPVSRRSASATSTPVPLQMPSIDTLQSLLSEHAALNKVHVPSLSGAIEGLIRRAKSWIKKQERTLSGTWTLVDAKNLLEEGRQISTQVDLNPEIGILEAEVNAAIQWCDKAQRLISSLALYEIDQLGGLVNSSFKGEEDVAATGGASSPSKPPPVKRVRLEDSSGSSTSTYFISTSVDPSTLGLTGAKEIQALKNYESSMVELTTNLATIKRSLVHHLRSTVLPTETELADLKEALGIVRDPALESQISQLFEGASKWSDRAEVVLSVPFPRPAGVLRALTSLIHDLRTSPMRYHKWEQVLHAASLEVWAHDMRYVTLPLPEGAVQYLVSTYPRTQTAEERMADDPAVVSETADRVVSSPTITPLLRDRESELASIIRQKQIEWTNQVLCLGGGIRDSIEEVDLLQHAESIRVLYAAVCEDMLMPRRSPMHTRKECEQFLDHLISSPLLHCPSLVVRVERALSRNLEYEAKSVGLREKLREDYAEYKSGSRTRSHTQGLFVELLQLLESVEIAELRVEHFDSNFTPIVGSLLSHQATVRGLFKWDQEESVTEESYRPTLGQLESAWRGIREFAERNFGLSEWFLQEVAYLASAHAALQDCVSWKSGLTEMVAELTSRASAMSELASISGLKKHISKWSSLAAQVDFEEIISRDTLARIDEWFARVSVVVASSGPKNPSRAPRTSLETAEQLLQPSDAICKNSGEFRLLVQYVQETVVLRDTSVATIVVSWQERKNVQVPLTNVSENGSVGSVTGTSSADPSFGESYDPGSNELSRLLRECRKSPIRVGVELALENELKSRQYNRTLYRLLNRPSVVPADLVMPFLNVVSRTDLWLQESATKDEENASSTTYKDEIVTPTSLSPLLGDISFQASPLLVAAAKQKLDQTITWNMDLAAPYAQHIESTVAGAVTASPSEKKIIVSSVPSTPANSDSIEAALNAPPTAAGEKILDMVLRHLDKECYADSTAYQFSKQFQPATKDYLYPLPLYQLPVEQVVKKQSTTGASSSAGASRRNGGTSSKQQQTGTVPGQPPTVPALPENPLMRKNLTSVQVALFQVPWTRPGQGYLSPVNEVMMAKPIEWVKAEKSRLKERINKLSPSLVEGLRTLLVHKRESLFQTAEYVKIRSATAQCLRTVKHCITRFPFLQPKATNVDSGTDIPAEVWEFFVQPSGGAENSSEAAVNSSSTNPTELDLFHHLLQLEAQPVQVPTKFRLLLHMLDMYDWRVKAQCVCHHMGKEVRPRPWTGDERSVRYWSTVGPGHDIFMASPVPPAMVSTDPLCTHVVPIQPSREFVLCSMHMSFFYVIESCRHFIRVMSDMCELCFEVTTTDKLEGPFWIACDSCDKWFHGHCAGLAKEVQQFTCPKCVLKSASASTDKKRMAMNILQSLPPLRWNPAPIEQVALEAQSLTEEATNLTVLTAVRPVELEICTKLVQATKQE